MSDFAIARRKMVDGQVRTSDVTDLRILDAMLNVPREAFVPPDQQPIAYLDLNVPVGGTPKRCLIQPAVLAKMIQAAAVRETDRVLVVGCATGYSAAVLARLAREVVATEADPALVATARETLSRLGIGNVTVVVAEAAAGAPEKGPYDVILLDGATEIVPENLYRQLAPEGRLIGVVAASVPARATLVVHSQDDFGSRSLFDAAAPVLPGLERRQSFVF